jgi:glyoxylase-like metal-dependent hydrolase (beta-lactamase superfamily II)
VGRRRLPVWDCTVGLVVGEGGALIIDPGSSLAEGTRLRRETQALAGRRVTFLALTHPHFDHVLGLVEESGEPQAGPDAVPSRWPGALDRLLGLGGEDALYVPGHGAVVDAGFVRSQRDALAARFGVSRFGVSP